MREATARGKKQGSPRRRISTGLLGPRAGALAAGLVSAAWLGLASPAVPGARPARADTPAAPGPATIPVATASTPAAVPAAPAPEEAPPAFAVMRFENRTGFPGLDWLGAAVPFLLGERVAYHLRARPALAGPSRARPSPGPSPARPEAGPSINPWGLPQGVPAPAGAAAVAAHARDVGATWVWTGWIAGRSRADMELGVRLWRVELDAGPGPAGSVPVGASPAVSAGAAVLAGELVATAPVEEIARLTGEAIAALAGHLDPAASDAGLRPALTAPPSQDFYAFTLLGRGLAEAVSATGTPGQVRWRLTRARRNLERAVLIDPRLAEGQRVLGEVYRALDRRDEARSHLAAALRLRPDYAPALVARAALARGDGELGRAVELYRRVLSSRPWDLARRHELGTILWERGQVDEALAELAGVVARAPEHLPARRLLVRIHARRGDREALLGELEALLGLEPGEVQARFDLAAVYLAAGRSEDAESVYQQVAGSPEIPAADRARAHGLLGDLARRAGHAEEAIAHYGRALDATPGEPRPYFLLAAMHLERGADAQAEKLLRQATQFPERTADAHAGLGAIAYRRGDLQEALWYLRRASWHRPRSGPYRYDLALVLSALGRAQDALHEIRVGLRHDPAHVGLHYLHGVVLLRQGKRDQARTWFEGALRLDPGHSDARHNLDRLVALAGEGPEPGPQGE